jgi:hypothetical protein
MTPQPAKIWLARILIGLVFFFNVQCALVFLVAAPAYAPSFELGGAAGEGMVRGLGLLFLMWNVPYALALWNPARYVISLLEAVVMQAIGFFGETALLFTFSAGHPVLRASIERFMLFDGSGLALLLLAAWLVSRPRRPAAA